MAKPKEIHDIQDDHFSKSTEDWTSHYAVDSKDLEKYLGKVEKEFLKTERENAAKNKKAYVNTKFDKNRDELFRVNTEKEANGKS